MRLNQIHTGDELIWTSNERDYYAYAFIVVVGFTDDGYVKVRVEDPRVSPSNIRLSVGSVLIVDPKHLYQESGKMHDKSLNIVPPPYEGLAPTSFACLDWIIS